MKNILAKRRHLRLRGHHVDARQQSLLRLPAIALELLFSQSHRLICTSKLRRA